MQWCGHGTWFLDSGKGTLTVDPFSSPPPRSDYVLVSHGHEDHMGAAIPLLEKGATLVANFEICNWFSAQGTLKTEPMNLGGCIDTPFARILMTHAMHSSTMPDGKPGGTACGFVVSLPGEGEERRTNRDLMPLTREFAARCNIYFACDTGLFGEMSWIGSLGLEVAVVPIGDRFTMGPAASIDAITRLRPKYVFPSHYNTWPPIEQDTDAWCAAVEQYTDALPVVLGLGESWSVSGADNDLLSG